MKTEMGRACSSYRESIGVYWVLVGERDGTRQLGRPWLRWKDYVKMDCLEVGSIWLSHRDGWRAVVITVMNHRVL